MLFVWCLCLCAFKIYYNVHCSNKFTIKKPDVPLTIYIVAEIVGKDFPQAFMPANIMKDFKRTGIWSFNSNLFIDADFQGESIIDRLIKEEGETNYIHDTSSPSTSIISGLNFAEANLSSVFIVSSLLP